MWPSQRVQRIFSTVPKNKGTSTAFGSENGDTVQVRESGKAMQTIKADSSTEGRGSSRIGILFQEDPRSRRPSSTTLPHKSALSLRNSDGYRREYGQALSTSGINSTKSIYKMSTMSVNFQDQQSMESTAGGAIETMGLLALKALCRRDSLHTVKSKEIEDGINSVNTQELEKLHALQDPSLQKEELCKMAIEFVKDREKTYKQLLKQKAKAKLFASPEVATVSDPKVRHILCIGGTTICGKEMPHGSYPNSFTKKKNLANLRKDPSGFKRFTAKCNLRGFKDEEISFTAEGNVLKVCGSQMTRQGAQTRKLHEEIFLPPGVYPDSLRIARDRKGVLIIQEPWSYSNQS